MIYASNNQKCRAIGVLGVVVTMLLFAAVGLMASEFMLRAAEALR